MTVSTRLEDSLDSSYETDGIPKEWEIKDNQLKLHCFDGKPVELGRGGHGIVLWGQVHKEDAAIKIIKGKGEEKEMLQEIMILERAKTKYVVRFLGYSLSPEGIVMAMEYAQSGNLYEALRNGDEFQWYKRWTAHLLHTYCTTWPLININTCSSRLMQPAYSSTYNICLALLQISLPVGPTISWSWKQKTRLFLPKLMIELVSLQCSHRVGSYTFQHAPQNQT